MGRSDPLRGHGNKAERTDSKLISGDKTSQVEVSTTMIWEFQLQFETRQNGEEQFNVFTSFEFKTPCTAHQGVSAKKKKKFRTLLGHKSSFFISMVTL